MRTNILLLLLSVVLIPCFAQTYKPELNLVPGETYNQIAINNLSITQEIMGELINISTAIRGKTIMKVVDIVDSLYDLEVSYESMIMKMSMFDNTMTFRSDDTDEDNVLSLLLGAMIGKPFRVMISKTGKVNQISSFENVFADIFDVLADLPETQRIQLEQEIKNAYGEDAFTSNFEMGFTVFPDHPVEIGDKWHISNQLKGKFFVSVETVYELVEKNELYYIISGESEMLMDEKDEFISVNELSMKYDLTGSMTSRIKLNAHNGWIKEAIMSQNMKGLLHFAESYDLPGGMQVPVTITNEILIRE